MIRLLFFIVILVASISAQNKVDIYKVQAMNGDAQAQKMLAFEFFKGTNIEQDYTMALCCFEKSANQGDRDAQYNLAVMHLKGISTPVNYKIAFHWFQESALQDHIKGQYNIGIMYLYGRGCMKDIEEAKFWLLKVSKSKNKKYRNKALSDLDTIDSLTYKEN